MLKLLSWLLLLTSSLTAQPLYTRLHAGYTLEALGVGPGITLSGEAPFAYRVRSFWNAQAGIGASSDLSGIAPSLSGVITYNVLLNPYYRSLCRPYPAYHRVEGYLESGLVLTVFDPTYALIPDNLKEKSLFSLALIGMRFHFVGQKWIYMLKLRFTPYIGREFPLWGGIGLGLGWR